LVTQSWTTDADRKNLDALDRIARGKGT
jgi:hypothetical protein